jgi:segregation and condensation protein A
VEKKSLDRGKAAPMDGLWSEVEDDRASSEPALTRRRATASRGRSISCCTSLAIRGSIWRASRYPGAGRAVSRICRTRRGRSGLNSPPTISSWPPGLPTSSRKLLIPKAAGRLTSESGRGTGIEILQFRLRRLEAMRDAAARLVNRNRLGRDVFAARHARNWSSSRKRNQYHGLALRPAHRLCDRSDSGKAVTNVHDRPARTSGRSRRRAMMLDAAGRNLS